MKKTLSVIVASLLFTACGIVSPLPDASTTEERLRAFPQQGLHFEQPVTLRWNSQQVPFIEAQTDSDAAYALGLVHAHLRLGQMEIMRRIAAGRIAEMAGPLAVNLDKSLRTLGYTRATSAMLAAMPAETRAWLDRYLEGLNDYIRLQPELPHEFKVLGLTPEPWRGEDILAIGRLSGTDVNWILWAVLLSEVPPAERPRVWARLTGLGPNSLPSFETENPPPAAAPAHLPPAKTPADHKPPEKAGLLNLLNGLQDFTKSGSNSLVIAPHRSASGAAMIASDPHLGVALPNLWLLAGLKSPSYHIVGAMVPGIPVFAFGRTPHLAWGGTNMLAAASDLVDLSDEPESALAITTETIRVRFWFDSAATVRTSAYGPIISDIPYWPEPERPKRALRWIGHQPSDEISALLAAAKAKTATEFRAAFTTFALPPQNFLFADAAGNIGQVTATILPERPAVPTALMRKPAEVLAEWQTFLTAQDLPAVVNPPQGYLASANNRPTDTSVPIGYVFAPNARIERLQDVLTGDQRISRADLMALQQDTLDPTDLKLKNDFINIFNNLPKDAQTRIQQGLATDVIALAASWDGTYPADSQNALAVQGMFGGAFDLLYQLLGRSRDADWVALVPHRVDLFREDLALLPLDQHEEFLRAAVVHADKLVQRFGTWGTAHRLRLQHPLGNVPVLGSRYRFGDLSVTGGNNTLNKRAHGPLRDLNAAKVRYGAQARHISDLGDPDANWFVLLGGQDGWLNSANFLDQMPLWDKGEYLQLPLSPAGVEQAFPVVMRLGLQG